MSEHEAQGTSEPSAIPWRSFRLDEGEGAYWRPLCSEAGCEQAAVRILGRYEHNDSMQGEYALFSGWFCCNTHAQALFNRLITSGKPVQFTVGSEGQGR